MTSKFKTIDLNKVTSTSLKKRRSLVSLSGLAKVPGTSGAISFFDSLPRFLKADDLKSLIKAIISARRKNKPVVLMCGGHLIKVGLNPVIIDLINRGLITGLCMNGAGLIHDSEIALAGKTSEDVLTGIADGSFGMSADTSSLFNEICKCAGTNNIGLGEAAGQTLKKIKAPNLKYSLLSACHRKKIPAMIHIAVNTDIVCQHHDYDPAAAAEASHHDFKILARIISDSENGGVFINVGSAVVLPEVFLKALTVSRNIYKRPYKIVTANFDMINHYRPGENIVRRPTAMGGKGYNFTGHHEIMIPLLAWGLKAMSKQQ